MLLVLLKRDSTLLDGLMVPSPFALDKARA